LTDLARIDATLVLFESGNRVQDTLRDLADLMGTRDAAICRELTKMHEEVRRANLAELARTADALETRGEFVLVIGPPAADAQIMTADALDDLLRGTLERGRTVRPAAPRRLCPRVGACQGSEHKGRP
jgi:16S rRNA (cytidine1402-2'-O)-methyltransferase